MNLGKWRLPAGPFALAMALLIGLLPGSAAGAEAEAVPGTGGASWTIMLYFCGSDLESGGGSASSNLEEALSARFGPDVNVTILTGGASSWKMDGIDADSLGCCHIEDGRLVLDEQKEAASMGEPGTLSDFISWSAETYPAEKYGLIMWDHGGGSLAGLCWDENFGDDNLTLTEYAQGLQDGGVSFEMIGMDACLMASRAPRVNYFLEIPQKNTEKSGGGKLIMVLTYIPEREAGCRTNRVTLRLTDSEMDWLREAAWTSRMSQAEFIRSRVFRSKVPEVPQELKELLHRLDYSISKVGNNINQIAKSANAAGYASAPMIRKTLTLQEELEETCQKMCNEIVEGIRHGRYETAPD